MSVYPPNVEVRRRAVLSADGLYRFNLTREWCPEWVAGRLLSFVMLNPSDADAERDDHTIRKCVGFARREGFDGIRVVNLDAWIATKPADLRAALAAGHDVTGGERNDDLLRELAKHRDPIVAAWGVNARPDRVTQVLNLMGRDRLVCFGTTKAGHPRHPLMLAGDTPLQSWQAAV